MVGTALTNITTSLSADILMPLIISSWAGSNIKVRIYRFFVPQPTHETSPPSTTRQLKNIQFPHRILPPPPHVNLSLGQEIFVVLRQGRAKCDNCYKTIEEAQEDGAVTLNYGRFFDSIVSFLICTLFLFILYRLLTRLKKKVEEEAAEAKKLAMEALATGTKM